MTKTRKIKDFLANLITVMASSLSLIVLVCIFVYIFRQSHGTLSFKLLKTNYWPENTIISFNENGDKNFVAPSSLAEDTYFSTKFGIAIQDELNHEKQKLLVVTYVDNTSPLKNGLIEQKGDNYNTVKALPLMSHIKKIDFLDKNGDKFSVGGINGDNAKATIEKLDNDAATLTSIYYQTEGGGLRGSLIATLSLIFYSLIFALPIGIFAAVYMNEIEPKKKSTKLMRSCIEMLAGVPSILFGLMGMTMLYPITKFFGIQGPSILLGSLTLAIILLPVIIRQTEEALLVVPAAFRSASLSLGATQTQTIFKIILPSALPGILSATLLSISRIIGESAALVYTMGTFINDSPKISKGATSLAVQIWTIMGGEQPNFELATSISVIILGIVLILNLSIKYISYILRRKWSI